MGNDDAIFTDGFTISDDTIFTGNLTISSAGVNFSSYEFDPIFFWSPEQQRLIRNLTKEEKEQLRVGDPELLPGIGLVQVVDTTNWRV